MAETSFESGSDADEDVPVVDVLAVDVPVVAVPAADVLGSFCIISKRPRISELRSPLPLPVRALSVDDVVEDEDEVDVVSAVDVDLVAEVVEVVEGSLESMAASIWLADPIALMDMTPPACL